MKKKNEDVDITKKKNHGELKARIMEECRTTRKMLKKGDSQEIAIEAIQTIVDDDDDDDEQFSPELDYDEMIRRCEPFFREIIPTIDEALEQASLEKDQIEKYILTGSTTRMERIQEVVSKYFGAEKYVKKMDNDTAVAQGATVAAHAIDRLQDFEGYEFSQVSD